MFKFFVADQEQREGRQYANVDSEGNVRWMNTVYAATRYDTMRRAKEVAVALSTSERQCCVVEKQVS